MLDQPIVMSQGVGSSRGVALRVMLAGLVCVLIGTMANALFLPHQSLWNDEATQLAGLSLSPLEATRWLAGRVDYDFGVPDDRMPPLSYWAGWGWSRVFGLGERPMRWFGVACVALATGIVFAAAHRAWGLAAGVAAALLLATSPNVIVQAVEIRAYPVLILASAGIFACLVGYATGPIESRRGWLAGISACGLAAMYTHFFGLVALGAALVAAFLLSKSRGERVLPVVLAGGVTGIAALGLGPFIFASTAMSVAGAEGAEGKMAGLMRLGYRLISHPATSVSPVAVALAALGSVVGIGCGLARKGVARGASAGLAIALVAGGAVVALAHLAQSSFVATTPSYNVWMLPALALLMASGLAAEARAVRATALAGIFLTLAANAYAAGQLAVHGDAFAHTPHRHIADLIRRHGPEEVAVIHDGELANAWHIYSPIRHEFGGRVRQFSLRPGDGNAAGSRVTDYPPSSADLDPARLPFEILLVVRSRQNGAKDVATQIRRGVVPLGDGSVTKALLAAGGWERLEEETFLAFVGADVDVFRRTTPAQP